MKKQILIAVMFLTFYGIKSQSKKIGNDTFKIEFLRTMSYLEGDFNNYYTDLVERSMFSKKDSLKYGFINNKGKEVVGSVYTYASDFYNGKSNIINNKTPGLLFVNGEEKYFSKYDATYWYKDDLGIVIKEDKYGFINTKGELIVPLIYEDAFPYFKGYASVKKDGKWNYINTKGEVVFSNEFIFSYRPIIQNNAIFMVKGNEVEQKKKMVSEEGSRTFVEFLNKPEKNQLKEGLININGKVLIEPIYDEISGYFKNGFMRVKNNGKAGIVNNKGDLVIPLEYDDISDIKNGLFLVKKSRKWGMINTSNKVVIPIEYNKIRHFKEDLALVSTKNGHAFINKKNEIIIKTDKGKTFSGDFNNGLALIRSNRKYGFVNKKNEIVIPIIYDSAIPFLRKNTIVKKDGESFLINRKGKRRKEKILKPYLWFQKEKLFRYAK